MPAEVPGTMPLSALGLSFRLLAIRYKWEMPKFVFNDDRR
jgi:uncharacterized membrane protein YeiH